jgi:hypothetical protein
VQKDTQKQRYISAPNSKKLNSLFSNNSRRSSLKEKPTGDQMLRKQSMPHKLGEKKQENDP